MSDPSDLLSLLPFHYESLEVTAAGPDTIRLRGTISVRDPFSTIQPVLRRIHTQVLRDQLPKLVVDVSELTFVNSSAVRLFVDWLVWLQREPEEKRYILRFLTDQSSTWQRASFPVLRSFAPSLIEIH